MVRLNLRRLLPLMMKCLNCMCTLRINRVVKQSWFVPVVDTKGLSFGSEGVSVAKWLNQNGIAAFVVKYRMPAGRQEVPVEDLTRAFEIVMANADKWNLDSCRIGLMGFSAGGHLAATGLVTLKGELKPDFGILVYPVISMKKNITHQFSRFNLMGKSPSEDTVIKFSTEEQVAEDTPATILFHCSDDPAVKPENSIVFYQALLRNAVPAEMHVYPKGRHGWGFIEGLLSLISMNSKLLFCGGLQNRTTKFII